MNIIKLRLRVEAALCVWTQRTFVIITNQKAAETAEADGNDVNINVILSYYFIVQLHLH